jgi:hypothetical protein
MELIASVIRVKTISKLGKTLAVTASEAGDDTFL